MKGAIHLSFIIFNYFWHKYKFVLIQFIYYNVNKHILQNFSSENRKFINLECQKEVYKFRMSKRTDLQSFRIS